MGFTKFLISPTGKIKLWQTDEAGNPHHGPVLIKLDKKYAALYNKDKAHLTDSENRSGYSEAINTAIQDGWVRGGVWRGQKGLDLFIQARDIYEAKKSLSNIPENLVNNADVCVIETLDKKNIRFPISHEDSLAEDMHSHIGRDRLAPLVHAKYKTLITKLAKIRTSAIPKEVIDKNLEDRKEDYVSEVDMEGINDEELDSMNMEELEDAEYDLSDPGELSRMTPKEIEELKLRVYNLRRMIEISKKGL
jgi:hypothetical protein